MGIFSDFQPLYAEKGIPTFPMQGKRPAVRGFSKAGSNLSQQWALNFPEANALAFMSGKRTRITPIDIDSDDEDLRRETERRYGATSIMVRTPSGGVHLWYLHNGETRKIRPDPNVPVDILGTGGLVIAPPSMGAKGTYEFIRGSLDDLHKLRPAANIVTVPKLGVSDGMQRVAPGGRNVALRDYLRSQARFCDDLDALLDVAHTFAAERLDTISKPFPDTEIISTAKSVWAWTKQKIADGEYYVGTGQRLMLSFDALDKVLPLGADATALYMTLQRRSNHRGELIVANDMRLAMPDGEWTLVRFRKARAALIEAGIIAETQKASTWHGAARYTWA